MLCIIPQQLKKVIGMGLTSLTVLYLMSSGSYVQLLVFCIKSEISYNRG